MSGAELRAAAEAVIKYLDDYRVATMDRVAVTPRYVRLIADLRAALAAPSTPEPSESVAAPSICPMCGGSGEVDRAAPSTEPALDVWVVQFSNYDPAEIAAMYLRKEDAEADADDRNERDDTTMWEVSHWTVEREYARLAESQS